MLTLLERLQWIVDADHLEGERRHLQQIFFKNSYAWQEIKHVFASYDYKNNGRLESEGKDPIRGFYSDKPISMAIEPQNIQLTSYPALKIKQQMHSVKDPLDLKVPGVHRVLCVCGASSVDQTGRTVNVRIVAHQKSIRFGQIDKFGILQHCWSLGDQVCFDKTMVLYRFSSWHSWITHGGDKAKQCLAPAV